MTISTQNYVALHDFHLCIVEGLSIKVDRLHLCDGIFLERGLRRVKGVHFWGVSQTILEVENLIVSSSYICPLNQRKLDILL